MKRIVSLFAIALAMTACSNRTNPFLTEWDTPFGIPPYEEIQISDYIPAIKAGIEQQNAEIDAIVSNPDAPTFENTIAPLEYSGSILSKVTGVLYNVTETETCPELVAVEEEAIPLTSEHSDNIAFNKALYNRVAAVYNADQSALTREQQVVLKNWYESFQSQGIGLPEEEQDKLRAINTEMATKIQKIGNNILAESNAFMDKFMNGGTTEDLDRNEAMLKEVGKMMKDFNAAHKDYLAKGAKVLVYRDRYTAIPYRITRAA